MVLLKQKHQPGSGGQLLLAPTCKQGKIPFPRKEKEKLWTGLGAAARQMVIVISVSGKIRG